MGACLEGNVRSERMEDILRSKEAIVSSVLAIVDYSAESDCDSRDGLFTLRLSRRAKSRVASLGVLVVKAKTAFSFLYSPSKRSKV